METVTVWDIVIRVFLWSLAALFISQLITTESLKKIHVNAGYFIIARFDSGGSRWPIE